MTRPLGRRGYHTLKTLHLVFSGTWLGSALCLLLVGAMVPRSADVLAMVEALQRVDLWVTVPCAARLADCASRRGRHGERVTFVTPLP